MALRPRDPLLVPVTENPALPESVKRNGDLFEIVFAFLLLPVMVATMDHPPFHLGGKVLLWVGTWFLIRRMPVSSRERVLAGVQVLAKPLILLVFLAALAITGALLAQFSGLPRFQILSPSHRWISGALLLPAFALVASLPLSVLVWAYLPVRFEHSSWLWPKFRHALPALGLAGIHLSTFGWVAPVLALAPAASTCGRSKGASP